MGRNVLLAAIAATGALAFAGCGSDGDPAADLKVSAPLGGPASIELTDGRLGDATVLQPGRPLRELSRGGRLEARPRGGAHRRDGVGAGAACANPELMPAAGTVAAIAEATLCLLNGERTDHGLAPLSANAKLTAVASVYAQDLVAGSYFSHTGRDGSDVFTRIDRSGYIPRDQGWMLGENLAWGTGALATPGSIMQAWMNSPGHRDNILNPDYREIGVGVATGNPAQADGSGATYATEFGVIEGGEAAAPTTTPAKPAARKGARKAARRHGKGAKAKRKARRARAAGKGRHKRHARRRDPLARIAI